MSTLEKNRDYSLKRPVDWAKPFSREDETNPRWNGNLVLLLTTLIADVNQPAVERDRAAEVLKYYLEKEKEFCEEEKQAGREPDSALIRMLLNGVAYVEWLWEYPERFIIQEKVDDGVLRRRVILREEKIETPDPIPQMNLIRQPEPVVEPALVEPPVESREWWENRNTSLDLRFSKEAVQERVNQIIAEANAQRKREQA